MGIMHIAWVLMTLLTDGRPQIEPVPQSKLVLERQETNEPMVVTYRVGGERRCKRIPNIQRKSGAIEGRSKTRSFRDEGLGP
jgi:hypothetical protein